MRFVYLIWLLMSFCTTVFALDLETYTSKKSSGLVSVEKADVGVAGAKSFLISEKRFDPETGVQLGNRMSSVTLQSLADRKKQLQDEIAEIDLLVADLKALN